MKDQNEIFIHGYMIYQCEKCGSKWEMLLETGVEDGGKNGREHQPCPYIIGCPYCKGLARDISGYIPLSRVTPIRTLTNDSRRYFAYDKSRKERACGYPKIFYQVKKVHDEAK